MQVEEQTLEAERQRCDAKEMRSLLADRHAYCLFKSMPSDVTLNRQ